MVILKNSNYIILMQLEYNYDENPPVIPTEHNNNIDYLQLSREFKKKI